MSENNFTEKASFIVALFAAFIAINYYSDSLKNIELSLGLDNYPLLYVFNVMLLILFGAVYFYALDYAKGNSAKAWKGLRYLKPIGNYCYALSLIILPLAIFAHLFSYLLKFIISSLGLSKEIVLVLSASIVVLGGIINVYLIGRSMTNKQRKEDLERVQLTEENTILQAEKLFKQGFYAPALVEMGKLIEIALQKKLLEEKNLDVKIYTSHQLIDLAVKTKLITPEIVESIKVVRAMRNKAAHLQIEFSKKEAEQALKETNNILSILDPKNKWD